MKMLDTLRSVVRFGPVETDRVERRLARAASVADLRRIAKRRLPGGVFDYIDGAAEDERTLAANEAAFRATTFRPRVLRGIEKVDVASTILGKPVAYPLVLAPTGFTRIADPDGELAVARARRAPGSPTRCRRSAPVRSKRCAPSATVACGSRCTRGATVGWCRR